MYWNNRVVRFKKDDDDWLEICEVFYHDGNPIGHTGEGVTVCGENVQALRVTLERMLECLNKPILDEME
jgi:hypothetical protein